MTSLQKYEDARHNFETLSKEYSIRRHELEKLRLQVVHAQYVMNMAFREYDEDVKQHKKDHDANKD